SLLGTYYLAQHAEKIGKTKKAKKLYETALTLNEFGAINIDFIYSKIDELDLANLAEDGKNDDKDDKDEEEEEEEDDN
ncbi:MAG: hypothetical protein ABF246_09770, partial [Winogradskyella sp.]